MADDFGHKLIKNEAFSLKKMVIKKAYFQGISQIFYQSEKFKHLMNYLTQNPSQAQLKEKNNQLLMRKDNMESVEEINRLLDKIL